MTRCRVAPGCKSWQVKIKNPFSPGSYVYLLYDTAHLFKNFYNNLVKFKTFTCPSFNDFSIQLHAKYDHLLQVYIYELCMPLKLAHKLNDKLVHPKNVEKTNVTLSHSMFHDSTIHALKYYSKNTG